MTITGTGFTGTTAVYFSGTIQPAYRATNVVVVSDTQITVTSPAHPAGRFNIYVFTPGGRSRPVSGDFYNYAAAPTVTSLSSAVGPASGGRVVTVTGTGFTPASTVTFGSTAAIGVINLSATMLRATTPPGTAGTVDVTVSSVGGSSTIGSADRYLYAGVPTIASVSPHTGPTPGGQSVTITGTGFTGTTAVYFSGTIQPAYRATNVVVVSDTQITVTSPAHPAGRFNIYVFTPGGRSRPVSGDFYNYAAAPTVTSLSSAVGPASGGRVVTVTGTGFTPASTVTFGSTAAIGVINLSATMLRATTPPGTAGTVDVTVSTVGGSSTIGSADRYLYAGVPTIASVSPNTGPTTGGQSVTITGTGFTGTTAVYFSGTIQPAYRATNVVVVSDTQITVTSPAHPAGRFNIYVFTPGGRSRPVSGDLYNYS